MKRKKSVGGGPLLDASASRSYSNALTRYNRVQIQHSGAETICCLVCGVVVLCTPGSTR